MKSRVVIIISALTLGTALAAVPSFAQTRDRANGPEVQQQSTGTVPQQESRGCVHFQQGCSDKPYSMAENGSANSERTGTRERSSSERTSGARTRVGERERLNGRARVSERVRGGARVSERARTSDEYMRSAAPEPSGAREQVAGREGARGETSGFGERRGYYNSEPGVEIADANRGAIGFGWCETRFHSFDPATGTYLGFDGIRHACP